ncbi:1-deoxy-D-xylulose-5-phosphate reductoisomerase [Spiroplasma endosymbiont of Amphibalanus improvisus]|uniref:1-deoxy-D-xylulose-5-phosphate reductoisomerase n=1 Tax=Spiroplasma endosymbiont of Amphibalanus improvisus TaxID=3066327 RepID=UPI00313CC1AC
MVNNKSLFILGASGNIGKQTQEIILRNPNLKYDVVGISVGKNIFELMKILKRFKTIKYVWSINVITISIKEKYPHIQFLHSDNTIDKFLKNDPLAFKLNAIQGSAGLIWSYHILSNQQQTLLLANKESLVLAGQLLNTLKIKNQNKIIPVDSEHNAILSCLEEGNKVHKIILTASGGPFVDNKISELKDVTLSQVIKHPTWDMGIPISINSATMVNKAYEIIEAYHLFGIKNIEVVIHRQSLIHSAVEFEDKSMKLLLSNPDMKQVISYALSYPKRVIDSTLKPIDLGKLEKITFEPIDTNRFKVITIANYCVKYAHYNSFSVALNSINETLQIYYLKEKINFYDYNFLLIKLFKTIKPLKLCKLQQIIDYHKQIEQEVINYLKQNQYL